jgi:molybdopterin synthase sulfur carrier subunit
VKVRVRLFAAARQAAGCQTVELELPPPATIGQLRRRLEASFPQMSGLLRHVTFAVDTQYVGDATEIRQDADVACIPPVSGG